MESEISLLPPRPKSTKKYPIQGREVKLHTNLYEVCLKDKHHDIEQYSIETEPYIDDTGISLMRRLINSKKKELQEMIGFLTSKGRMVWGTRRQ